MNAPALSRTSLAFGRYAERRDPPSHWVAELLRHLKSRVGHQSLAHWPAPLAVALRHEAQALAGVATSSDAWHAARQACVDDLRRGATSGPHEDDRTPGFSAHATAQALGLAGVALQRSLGLQPYDTQYLAAWLILQGRMAEMATGEGKTVAIALAAAVAALAGRAVHVLTANDYLVQRDAQAMQAFYASLGLSSGAVVQATPAAERGALYQRSVLYTTAKEVGFDYLRDHHALSGTRDPRLLRALSVTGRTAQPLLPGLVCAIVDEADALLLDEACVPLILAVPQGQPDVPALQRAFDIATTLVRGTDFALQAASRQAELSAAGRARVAAALGVAANVAADVAADVATGVATDAAAGVSAGVKAGAAGAAVATAVGKPPAQQRGLLWPLRRAHDLVQSALVAQHVLRNGFEYVVAPRGLLLVDELTGRVAQGRQWTGALHNMVEIKEGLPPSSPNRTAAQITYQRLFPRYLHLAGVSGTLHESRVELARVYGCSSARVPLAVPSKRVWQGRRVLPDEQAQWQAVISAITQHTALGRPVLVGTESVLASQRLSQQLVAAGIAHQVLNALQDGDEAQQVAQAGRAGAVTVTTNMAGRGTDIRPDEAARAAGGLHVIVALVNRSRRIDRQLLGRSARHGDPGSAQALLSLDDSLLRRTWPARVLRLARALARGRGRVGDGDGSGDGDVPPRLAALLLAGAQRTAEWADTRTRSRLRRADRQAEESFVYAGHRE